MRLLVPPEQGSAPLVSARVCGLTKFACRSLCCLCCTADAAWTDVPTAADTAHATAECSNAGICNRNTGQCECFAGFEGDACQRSTLPVWCRVVHDFSRVCWRFATCTQCRAPTIALGTGSVSVCPSWPQKPMASRLAWTLPTAATRQMCVPAGIVCV